jgi:hypothetical protein
LTIYAIGAGGLTGGGLNDLDFEFAEEIGNGDPAFVTVQGDKIYHYIADLTSGAAADGINVIVPLWNSDGVAYTGDLRWILHGIYGTITSTPGVGEYKIVDIRLDSDLKMVVKYNNVAET